MEGGAAGRRDALDAASHQLTLGLVNPQRSSPSTLMNKDGIVCGGN